MYSDKINIAILTTLLREHGVRQAVVCPGSRNAAIVNNLTECPEIECHAATDERSAAFEAMGISLATGKPTAVCVTSGTALLNTLPAVAEAWYQKVPLVVVSADRPSAWIEQLDGQTLNQPGALERWCCESIDLPETKDGDDRWRCNWLVNKALVTAVRRSRPVHINVRLSEPLYNFRMEKLPEERVVRRRSLEEMNKRFAECGRVMIVTGQQRNMPSLNILSQSAAIVAEPLAWCGTWADGDRVIEGYEEPEMVIYLGGTIVSKRVKEYLRGLKKAEQWFVSTDGEMADTFMNLGNVVFDNDIHNVVRSLEKVATQKEYAKRWMERQEMGKPSCGDEEEVVRKIEVKTEGVECNFCYANSMSVRYACRHARRGIYCNRGINGIEGTVSTALGVARGDKRLCICVTGDLSFFYDSNALWRRELPGNLRIVVLNNGGGKIFERFEGLKGREARGFVVGEHETGCRGMCEGYGVKYRKITSREEIDEALEWLINGKEIKVLEYENMEKD